jgi:hypothetical protein
VIIVKGQNSVINGPKPLGDLFRRAVEERKEISYWLEKENSRLSLQRKSVTV